MSKQRRSEPSNKRPRFDHIIQDPSHYTTSVALHNVSAQQLDVENDSTHQQQIPALVTCTGGGDDKFLAAPRLVGSAFIWNLGVIFQDLGRSNDVIVGIHGMGGVGKTALALNLHNKIICSNENFGEVLWVTVPKDASVYELQEEIARELKIPGLLKDVYDVRKRAATLRRNLISREKCILFLDDLWQQFEYVEVGIPVGSSGLRLVLTTRSLTICNQMQCNKVINIELLSNREAFDLFLTHHKANKPLTPRVKEIAVAIVNWCCGLPLAIVALARSMRGDVKVGAWKFALSRLKGSIEDEIMDKHVIPSIKRSYDVLPPQIQQCLLMCALLPEDLRDDSLLKEFFIDEELIGQSDSRMMMHNEGQQIIDHLTKSGLFGYEAFEDHRIHNLVKRTALHILSRNNAPSKIKVCVHSQNLPDTTFWAYDLVSTLMVIYSSGLSRISDSFFQQLPNLTVLNLSCTDLKELPESISNLIQLKALELKYCNDLCYIPCLEKLKLLRKLDLAGCYNLFVAPTGLARLVNLTYLDLSGTGIIKLGIGVLSELVELQILGLDFPIWTEIARLKKLELIRCHFSCKDDMVTYLMSSKCKIRKFYQTYMKDSTGYCGIEAQNYYISDDDDDGDDGDGDSDSDSDGDGDGDYDDGDSDVDYGDGDYDEMCTDEIFAVEKQVKIFQSYLKEGILHNGIVLPSDLHSLSLSEDIGQDGSTGGYDGRSRLHFFPHNSLNEATSNNLWNVMVVQEEGINIPSNSQHYCYALRKLNINVPTLKYIFSIAATGYLENLQHLKIRSCVKLTAIVAAGSVLPSGAFRKLKSISINSGKEMKAVVGIELVPHLRKLELIEVSWCDNVEEIIATSSELIRLPPQCWYCCF